MPNKTSARLWVERISTDEGLRSNLTDAQARPVIVAASDLLIALDNLDATWGELEALWIVIRDSLRAVNQRLKENV